MPDANNAEARDEELHPRGRGRRGPQPPAPLNLSNSVSNSLFGELDQFQLRICAFLISVFHKTASLLD